MAGDEYAGRRRVALTAGLAVTAIAVAGGYVLGQMRSAGERQQLEASNRQLRESVDTLAEGLREARAPLQRRIHTLESALAESRSEPGAAAWLAEPQSPGAKPARTSTPALAVRITELAAELERLRQENAALAAGRSDDELSRRALETQVAELEDRLQAAAQAAETTPRDAVAVPHVAAAPPVAEANEPKDLGASNAGRRDPVCVRLEDGDFRLDTPDTRVERLGGRLTVGLSEQPSGPYLTLGEAADDLYPLESLPQHVAFDCDGVPYIVSVCEISREPLAVEGVIWQAEVWRDACR